jgi:rod shape-determining protein MreC
MSLSLRSRVVDWVFAGLLILIPAGVLRASLSRGTPSPVDKALLRITAPLEAGVSWVVEGIGGVWSRYVALVDVESENRELRDDNEQLRKQLSLMTRRAYDVEALEDLAKVKRATPADTIGAHVIGASLSPEFRVVRLRIDRGKDDVKEGLPEVKEDMPVITGAGPIGTIGTVYGDYADVRLLSDTKSKVEVIVSRTGAHAILKGLGKSDSYACELKWLASARKPEDKVQVGDEIVTSGMDENPFPAGLVVGKITQVNEDDGMMQSVLVEPSVDLSRVRAVMILLAKPATPDPNGNIKRKSEPAFGTRPL